MKDYWRRPIHVSWFIAWVSTGLIIGIALSLVLPDFFTLTQGMLIAFPLLVLSLRKRTRLMIIFAFGIGLTLGLARGNSMRLSLAEYQPYYGKQITMQGKVSEDTVFGPQGDQRAQVASVHISATKLPGKVWVSTDSSLDIKRGDIVTFGGVLHEGFGNLPASMFRAHLVGAVRSQHGDVAREVRDWFASGVRRAISEPEASLGVGYLVGQRSTLPENLDNQLRMLGLTHVVVASGYNLTILVRFAKRALVKKSKYLATMSAAAMIFSFVLITGFSPSMSRAALVTGLSLAAWYFGRKIHPFVLLPLAAAVTAMLNPAFVWGDIGWYLSFVSFAGIMILAPLLRHYFWGDPAHMNPFSQILLETMSAQIATLPIIAFVFGQYSLLALPANLLILPLIPFTMALTFVAGIVGVGVPSVAEIFGWPASAVLHYMTSTVEWLAKLPGAASEVVFGLPLFIVSYLILVAVGILIWRKTRHNFGEDSIVE